MTYSTVDDYSPPAISLRAAVARHAMRAGGLGAIALSAALIASLATWHVDDPSFSYAADGPARNLLGRPGAAFADLGMQLLGLGVIGFVFPLAMLGWNLLRLRPPRRPILQTLAWLGGALLLSAALACLPIFAQWPLPTGLGGAAGDLILATPEWLGGGALSSGLYAALCVVLGGLSLGLLWASCLRRSAKVATAPRKASRPRTSSRYDEDEDDEDSLSHGRLRLAAGVLGHWLLAGRAALRRGLARNASNVKPAARASQPPPAAVARREPRFQAASRAAAPEPAEDGYDDSDADFAEDEYEAETTAAALPPPPQRTVALRQPPVLRIPDSFKSGRRYAAEPEVPVEADAEPVAPPRRPPVLRIPDSWKLGRRAVATRQERPVPEDVEADFEDARELDMPDSVQASPRSIVQPPAPKPRPAERVVKPVARPPASASGEFELPPLELLTEPKQRRQANIDQGALEQNARLLEGVLEDFGVRGEIINVKPGPVVTLYELEPAPGIKSSRVISLADDIARSMSAIAARVAVIPGRNVIGIELPNQGRETVFLRELLGSADFDGTKARLALALGKTIGGEPVVADLAKMPHLLVAGTTGSGKSVAINTMILALVYRMTPEQCRLIMIDPKMLELSVYDGIPHLLTPVVTDPKKAVVALKWTVREMEDRYKKMSKLGVRNIDGYNQRIAQAAKKGELLTRTVQTGFDHETGEPVFETEELDLEAMPYIVVIIDEMADLMMVAGKEIEGAVQRLAQMARAAGIHVIMATQRPSVDVITGTIKANFPTRISFQVTSKIDSRTILGEQGAEQLLGQGDMLYMAGGGRIQRVHGPFVSDEEVEEIVAHLKSQGAPDYLESITAEEDGDGGAPGFDPVAGGMEDSADLYDQAVAVVIRDRKASTSYIQRRLSIGYNRAASLIEKMEKEGVVGAANHAGKREILVGEDAA